MSTQAAPAPAGPSIPVRHTHRSQTSVSGTAGDALARQSAAALTAQPSEWSVESVRAHYEPLLAAKQARRDDLQQRLRKQQSRLHSMVSRCRGATRPHAPAAPPLSLSMRSLTA